MDTAGTHSSSSSSSSKEVTSASSKELSRLTKVIPTPRSTTLPQAAILRATRALLPLLTLPTASRFLRRPPTRPPTSSPLPKAPILPRLTKPPISSPPFRASSSFPLRCQVTVKGRSPPILSLSLSLSLRY